MIIENDSFFQLDKFYWREILQNDATETNYQLKSFHILNCESLESIQIDEYSFCDFGGDFELRNLPQLQSIQIGEIEKISGNFYHSSLVIRGIDVILSNEYAIDLPNLQSITLGDTAFNASLHTVIESMNWIRMKWLIDLPSLQSIQLGYEAVEGDYSDSCSLIMRGKNVLNRMIKRRSSKFNIHSKS